MCEMKQGLKKAKQRKNWKLQNSKMEFTKNSLCLFTVIVIVLLAELVNSQVIIIIII